MSRILKYLGVRASLFSLPLIGVFAYGSVAVVPLLALVRIAKIAENSCDYSLYNTTTQALWLPTTPAQKYNAKMATDSFIVRAGDLISGLGVPAGLALGLGSSAFAWINLGLVGGWLALVVLIRREHYARTDGLATLQKAA